jgi:hypothetical protein
MIRRSLLSLLVGLFGITCATAFTQTVQGVITGRVVDPSGAAIVGAAVTLTNNGTGATQTATTGSAGDYRFPLVPPGTYTVKATASGFGAVENQNVTVQASQVVPLDFKLPVGRASQSVTVTSEIPLVQTATSDLNTQIDRTTIQNMALVDRDVFSTLPFLATQAAPGMDVNVPVVGGSRESGTSYMLNGAEDNDNFSEGAINVHPPLESVQDFTMLTNNFSAQYGRGGGAVVTANQKSGSNKFHGVVYEFNRNATLNANDWFYNRDLQTPGNLLSKRPKYIRNQFGGEVDGPIKRDKTFFSGAYDRLKLSSGTTQAHNYVPTSAAVAFIKGNGSPIAKGVLSALPPVTSDAPCPGATAGTTGAGSTGGVPNTVGCLSFFDPQTDTVDTYYGRVDQGFRGSNDRLTFVANLSRELYADKFGGGPLTTKGAIPADTHNHFHQLELTETHLFGAALVNEATLGHNRHYNVFVEGNGTKDTIPNMLIDEQNEGSLSYEIGGDYEGGLIENFTQDRWSFQDNLSWTRGTHSLRFGGGTQYGIVYRNWDLGLPGQYEFGELITVNSSGKVITPASEGVLQPDGTIANMDTTQETDANFAGDFPYFQETSVDPSTGAKADAYRHYMYHDNYWFVQDDWKATPRLTLNLGLRWDRYGAPTEAHGLIAQFTNFDCNPLDVSCVANARVNKVPRMWNTRNGDFGPRLGFAYDVFGNGKMAIRGGFGIFYDRIFDNIWSNGAWNPPLYALIDFEADTGDAIYYSNPPSIGAAYNPNGPCGPIPYGPNPATGCTGNKRVSVRTMNQHLKDSSGQNFYFGVEHQIGGSMLVRANYQGELGRHLAMLQNENRFDGDSANSSLSFKRPNPLYTGFNYRNNAVSSNYNALVVEAQKRMSHGLQFQTGYTYSKLLDYNSELFAGCSTVGAVAQPYYFLSKARPQLNYGRGAYDHRGAVKYSFTWAMPFMRAEKGFAGHVLGGWNLGSLFQFYTGHPVQLWDNRTRYPARDASGKLVLDPSGVPYNLGGDYNLDGVSNEYPVFTGSPHDLKNFYSHKTPANGFFRDNNPIGCGASWIPANVANVSACNKHFGATTPNAFFQTPAYPSSAPYYERYGSLGRNVVVGPRFAQMDVNLNKNFNFTEAVRLNISGQAQNLMNHPNFDCLESNVSSGQFGQATCLTPFGLGEPKSRVMMIGARLSF